MAGEISLLQDRLRDHSNALNGLLSLIPAKAYYGEDNSGQWNKKKQTKLEAAAARRGKLDPDSELNRNAKEVMDERAHNKRKLRDMQREEEEEEEAEDQEDENICTSDDDESMAAMEGIETEKPREGLKKKTYKKQQIDDSETSFQSDISPRKLSRKEEKRASKRERKAQKKAKKVKESAASIVAIDTTPSPGSESTNAPCDSKTRDVKPTQGDTASAESLPSLSLRGTPKKNVADNYGENQETMPSQEESGEQNESSSASECSPQAVDTSEFEANDRSVSGDAASLTKSATSTTSPSKKQKHIQVPADMTALRARLAAKIEALRAARKADGPDGKPIRTRQELIELRRAKQAQRKAHRKELWMQAKREEERKIEEALASNSPGVMSPSVDLDESAGNFSFGRVIFGDGSQMSHDLSRVLHHGKRKGPSDAKTALLKVQNQKKRLQQLDAEKWADIADKEAWLTARRRVEGDKIRDDEAILKKAVKRKEAAKKKSEKAWKERTQGVEKAQKERHKKREENIRKRRDDRASGKTNKKKGRTKKGGRPGFEGSFGVGGRSK